MTTPVGIIMNGVTGRMGMNPFPFLVSEILASNIGGSSTLIGDPPNILIGSAAGLDFTAFLIHMAPLAVLLLGLYLVAARWLFRDMLTVDPQLRASLLELNERDMIANPSLLRVSLAVLGLMLAVRPSGTPVTASANFSAGGTWSTNWGISRMIGGPVRVRFASRTARLRAVEPRRSNLRRLVPTRFWTPLISRSALSRPAV